MPITRRCVGVLQYTTAGQPIHVLGCDGSSASATARYGLLNCAAGIAGQLAPERDRGVEVEVRVEVQAHPETRFVDVEEVAQPGEEDGDHPRIAVRERDRRRRVLLPSPAYRREAERSGTRARTAGRCARPPSRRQRSISASLARCSGCGRSDGMAAIPRPRDELDVADPERHRRLRHAELGGDVGQRPRLARATLAPVAVRRSLPPYPMPPS